MLAQIIAAASFGVWLYLLLSRGGFWAFREEPPPSPPASLPSIVVVIPARNEAAVVGKAVASLAKQEYSGTLHVVVVDDDSTDDTAAAALASAPPGSVTVMEAGPLPPGWTGKLWAVSRGVREAARLRPDFILLTDADIVHPPGNLGGLVGRAAVGGFDLVSYMATLECEALAERALIPAFVFFFFMLYPPAWVGDARRRTAAAAGGCVLVRAAALERAGGIEAIRGELIDDCALAGAVKRSGGRVWLGLSSATRSIRRYATFAEAERMISRSAYTQLRHSPVLLAATLAGLALTYAAPPFAVLGPFGAMARISGGAAWVLMSLCYFPALRFYRRSPLWAPLLPLVAVFYACATVHSAVAYWRGTGGMWKGRRQDTR